MAFDKANLICRRDRDLRERLQSDSGVQLAQRKVDERQSGYGFLGRRRLLTGSLRVTRRMMPSLVDLVQGCRDTLGVTAQIELFIKPDPQVGAYVMKSASGPWAMALTSTLVERFDDDELRFVIGHELGHVLFDHTSLPMPAVAMVEDLAGTIVSRQKAIELYLWCRAAEISADRAGLACCGRIEAAASAFMKLSSGLSRVDPGLDITDYIAQVDSLASSPAARQKPRDDDDTLDCFNTHPYSPLRLRALVAWSRSAGWAKARGGSSYSATLSESDAEDIIERDLAMMEPTYLEEKGDDAELLRRVLFLASLKVAWADGVLDPREQKAIIALLGDDVRHDKHWGDDSAERQKADEELTEMLAKAKELPLSRKGALVQHLTIIAGADGVVDDSEVKAMIDIAAGLGVDAIVIDETLRAAAQPLD